LQFAGYWEQLGISPNWLIGGGCQSHTLRSCNPAFLGEARPIPGEIRVSRKTKKSALTRN